VKGIVTWAEAEYRTEAGDTEQKLSLIVPGGGGVPS
jgi:hypothetical protein